MTIKKKIILLRHGQAETASILQTDISRKLSLEGLTEAENVGKILLKQNITPDLVVCSTAIRTCETFSQLQKSFATPLKIEYRQEVYNASAKELENIITSLEEDLHNILIIGHNPALYQLATTLAKTGDEALIDNLHLQFPPCSIAIIEIDEIWKNIGKANGRLIFFAIHQLVYKEV